MTYFDTVIDVDKLYVLFLITFEIGRLVVISPCDKSIENIVCTMLYSISCFMSGPRPNS